MVRRPSLTEQENLAFFLELFGVLFNNPVDFCRAQRRFSILSCGCAIAHGHTKALKRGSCYSGMVVAQPQELVWKRKKGE